MEEKKKSEFNIMSTKEHRGFGAGALDLNLLSSIIVDGDDAYIDLGAIHAKSKVERGIKFTPKREDVPHGRRCWIVWVKVAKNESGSFYAGLSTCEMVIDTEAKIGFKSLPDHVNRMDAAMKHRILVDGINEAEKVALRGALIAHSSDMWENTPDQLKECLA